MSRNSDVSNVSRRQFLAVAGSVAAASSLAVGTDAGSSPTSHVLVQPAHYLVTMDVSKGSIKYSAKNRDDPTQVVPMPNNCLTVKKGDEVKWEVATSSPNPQYSALVLFTTGTPFDEREFRWSENALGGDFTTHTGQYYYCVGIYDKLKPGIFADDPKIIVGGTADVLTEVEAADVEVNEVREKMEVVDHLLKKVKKQLEASRREPNADK